MRMNNMGTEQRAKMLARQQNRDISEKIALGLTEPTLLSKESMLNLRLFNQELLSGSFGASHLRSRSFSGDIQGSWEYFGGE
jgi:SNW domain-containing protein 1